MKWKIGYYNDGVFKDVQHLEKSIKANYIALTDRMIQDGPDLGLPHTRAMGKGLFEIRVKGKSGIARAFFCTISNNTIMILHVFIKKTQQTPKKELELAKKRMKEVKNYGI